MHPTFECPDCMLHVLVYYFVLLVLICVFVKILLIVSLICDKVVGLFVNCLLSGTNTISGRYQLSQFGKGEELEEMRS